MSTVYYYNMIPHLLLSCITITCGFLINAITGEQLVGEGKWSVMNVAPCEDHDKMPWRGKVRRHKYNRTHESFDADFTVGEDLDDSFGIRIETCIRVDGGCKLFSNRTGDCLPCVLKKFAARNMKRCLTFLGLDPPDFPIPKGEYHVKDYILDFENLFKAGIYGEFGVNTYIIKDGKDLACMQLFVKHVPVEDS